LITMRFKMRLSRKKLNNVTARAGAMAKNIATSNGLVYDALGRPVQAAARAIESLRAHCGCSVCQCKTRLPLLCVALWKSASGPFVGVCWSLLSFAQACLALSSPSHFSLQFVLRCKHSPFVVTVFVVLSIAIFTS
jgi:hypothetical protein